MPMFRILVRSRAMVTPRESRVEDRRSSVAPLRSSILDSRSSILQSRWFQKNTQGQTPWACDTATQFRAVTEAQAVGSARPIPVLPVQHEPLVWLDLHSYSLSGHSAISTVRRITVQCLGAMRFICDPQAGGILYRSEKGRQVSQRVE